MPITLETPVVVPATTEKTYNEVWLSFLQVNGGNPNAPIQLIAQIDPARTLENGQKELMPDGKQTVIINDLYGEATEAELQLVAGVVLAVKARAGL